MSYKIQITVNEQLNNIIHAKAQQLSLSISSYARLVLINSLFQKKPHLLNQAMEDISSNRLETISLNDFNEQIDQL